MTMIAWRSSLDAPCWEQSFDEDRDFHLSRNPSLGDPPFEVPRSRVELSVSNLLDKVNR